jgi:hypothetical protein
MRGPSSFYKHRQYNSVGYTKLIAHCFVTLPDPLILVTTLASPV